MAKPLHKTDLPAALAQLMKETRADPGRTKRSAARLAIVKAIRNGILCPGDYLPPETQLTSIFGVSLGTVQAALRQLQQTGTIVRRRGAGSRIASTEPLVRDVWHFRFLARTNDQPLRMMDETVWIDKIEDQGNWSDFLGIHPQYIRIRRKLIMQNGMIAGAEMYLDAALAPGLEDIDPSELGMINIRPFLEDQFGIATASANHVVQTRMLDRGEAATFGLPVGAEIFEIHAKAYSSAQQPVYFQRILADVTACKLTF